MSATAGVDYRAEQNKPVTVEPGQSKAVFIEIVDDKEVESDEGFFVNISGEAVSDRIKVIEITIRDDDGKLTHRL